MKLYKYFFIGLLLSICFSSCNHRVKAKFEIINSTSQFVDSLVIEPNNETEGKFIAIGPGQTIKYFSDMTNIIKSDGDYSLTFKLNNQIKKRKFGYYTNGNPIESLITINIKKDTVIFDFHYD